MTFHANVKFDTLANSGKVVYKNNSSGPPWYSYQMYITDPIETGSYRAYFQWCGTGGVTTSNLSSSSTALPTDTWYHLAGVHSGTNLTLYVDGSDANIDNDGTTSGTLIDSDDDFEVGYRHTSEYPIDGIIDEVRLSSVARSENWLKTETDNLNNPGIGTGKFSESAGNEEELVVFANLYEGTAQIAAADYSITVDITDVTLSKSFLVFSSTVNDNQPQCNQIRGQLYDSGSGDIKIDFERMESSGCALADIRYCVAEFTSGVSV